MTTVKLFVQDYKETQLKGLRGFEENWELPRKIALQFETELTGEAAAEQAFHLTNAPEEMFEGQERIMVESYRGPSMSVGDIAEVDGVEYLCAGIGWKKRGEIEKTHNFKVGQRVVWRDPSPIEENNFVHGTIQDIQSEDMDAIISLAADGGSEIEALPHELTPE